MAGAGRLLQRWPCSGPSSIVACLLTRVWARFQGRAWHTALQSGLAPIGVGLVAAGIVSLFQAGGGGALSVYVALAVAIGANFLPKVYALAFLAAGAILFLVL
jgi:chromate transporter